MRKIIVSNIMSLDGYYAGPNEDALVLPMDAAFDAYNAERLRAADTMLLGATSYQLFRAFWAPVAEDETATAIEREISRLTNAIEKVVISDRADLEQVGPWNDARIIRRKNAYEELALLKQQEGRDILMFGSHILWNDLMTNGLIDELHLMVGQVVLGEGTRLFEAKPPAALRLLDSRLWEGSDNILLRYAVDNEMKLNA